MIESKEDIETIKKRIASVIPHMLQAAQLAKSKAKDGATVQFAVIAKNPDGSGSVGASFDCDTFLADLAAVFPPSIEDMQEARFASIFGPFGL